MMIMISNFLRTILSSGILDGNVDMEKGGPECDEYMSHEYRSLISFIMV